LFAEVDREGQSFVARVKLVAHDNTVRGARTLKTTGACSDLMATLALTISIAIDPMAGTRSGPPEGLPPSEKEVEITEGVEERPPPEPPTEPEKPPVEPPARRIGFAFGAGAIGSLGSAPGPALGFAVFARARLADLSLSLEGR